MSIAKKDTTIFISGGTGFLGAYLLRRLIDSGYTKVRALKRTSSRMDLVADIADKVDWIEGDVLDVVILEEALQGVDWVFHCAAIVSFDERDAKKMLQVNVEGTANMVNLSLYRGVRKFVHTSSIAAIGRHKKRYRINENSKWIRSKLNTNYAISKYLAEQEVWRASEEGLKVAVVNPSVILGSGYWEMGTAALFKKIWKGLSFYPTGQTGYVDVRDVARFMLQLMESDVVGERFILNSENLTYKEFFETLAYALQTKPPGIKVTPFWKEVIWRLEWVRSRIVGGRPIITREIALNTSYKYFYENDKSLAAFPNFNYNSVVKTIAETAKQFLEGVENNFQPAMLPK